MKKLMLSKIFEVIKVICIFKKRFSDMTVTNKLFDSFTHVVLKHWPILKDQLNFKEIKTRQKFQESHVSSEPCITTCIKGIFAQG